MRMFTFSSRCVKEILRDKVNLIFGLGFPVVLLLLLSIIQRNIPVSLFRIEMLSPGIAVFGLSFMTLFSATLISKDKESLFLQRLYATPMRSIDFIAGYMLPLIPVSVLQSTVCYAVAVILGLPITVNVFCAVVMIIPISFFYVSHGLLCGSILSVKQVGGICGALLTNLSVWLSGVWFDIGLVGGLFEKAAKILPFFHAVQMEKALFDGNFGNISSNLIYVVMYGVLITIIAVYCFLRQMKRQ